MKSITEIQEKIIDDFNMFEDWMQKYEYLIELGKELPVLEKKNKKDENLIKGCQSRVWLHAEKVDDKIKYSADSDAIMTKGIIALLVGVLSNQEPSEIMKAKLSFIDEIGIKDQLSLTRDIGLVSMIKQMKFYALALNNENEN